MSGQPCTLDEIIMENNHSSELPRSDVLYDYNYIHYMPDTHLNVRAGAAA